MNEITKYGIDYGLNDLESIELWDNLQDALEVYEDDPTVGNLVQFTASTVVL